MLINACLLFPSYIGSENFNQNEIETSTFSPQLILISNVFFWSAAHYLPVYGFITWCAMYRLFQTSDSVTLDALSASDLLLEQQEQQEKEQRERGQQGKSGLNRIKK